MAFPLLAAALPSIIGVGASLLGGSGSSKAAKQQVRANEKAIATQEKYLGPYAQLGMDNIGPLQDFINNGANFADTQAFKDIANMSRASGNFGSGNLPTALTDYYATNFRPQRFNELTFLPQLGAGAAGNLAAGIGGLQQNIGDAQAAGTIGKAQNYASGLGALAGIDFLGMMKQKNISTGVTNLLNQPGMF